MEEPAQRPIIAVVKNCGHTLVYYKCMHEGCEARASKEFCCQHARKLNKCAYPNCTRNCKGVHCHFHNERALNATRLRAKRWRAAKRAERVEIKIDA